MKNKLIITLCFFGIGLTTNCQDLFTKSTITDDRDGKEYKTIQINNTIWLAENMKFKTENSVIILENELGIDTDGFYYPFEEADKVCPNGFDIPKESDWNEYVNFLLELKSIPESSAIYSSHSSRRVTGTSMKVMHKPFSYFDNPNPLNLKISGMIEGGHLVSFGALNFWSRKDDSSDIKYHLHIQYNEYGNHSHKHHVQTRNKKKIRKFAVRCVKQV